MTDNPWSTWSYSSDDSDITTSDVDSFLYELQQEEIDKYEEFQREAVLALEAFQLNKSVSSEESVVNVKNEVENEETAYEWERGDKPVWPCLCCEPLGRSCLCCEPGMEEEKEPNPPERKRWTTLRNIIRRVMQR